MFMLSKKSFDSSARKLTSFFFIKKIDKRKFGPFLAVVSFSRNNGTFSRHVIGQFFLLRMMSCIRLRIEKFSFPA